MAEKLRVHHLAVELGVGSKDILQKCRDEDLDLKNHMSTVTAGLAATIREWFSEGSHLTTVETTERIDLKKVRVKRRPRKKKKTATVAAADRTCAAIPRVRTGPRRRAIRRPTTWGNWRATSPM